MFDRKKTTEAVNLQGKDNIKGKKINMSKLL